MTPIYATNYCTVGEYDGEREDPTIRYEGIEWLAHPVFAGIYTDGANAAKEVTSKLMNEIKELFEDLEEEMPAVSLDIQNDENGQQITISSETEVLGVATIVETEINEEKI